MSMISPDLRISSFPFESSSTAPQNTVSSLNGRMVVNAGNSCCDWMTSIPKMIGGFFTRRYADGRMFFRSFSSMGGGTTTHDIDRRINEITQFITVIETCGSNRNVVRESFERLTPEVRNLFFYVDQHYIDEFVNNPSKTQEISQEVIRECDRAISFQRQLTAVNAFYSMFSGGGAHTPDTTQGGTTTDSETTGGGTIPRPREAPIPVDEIRVDPQRQDPWIRLFPNFFHFRDGIAPVRPPVESPPATTHGFNLNVPGTVPYVQNAIPAEVLQKAQEINSLKGQFASMGNPPPVPEIFKDIITTDDFMEFPVFDASHPAVQNALSSGSTEAINNRDLRHLFNKDTLEQHIQSGHSWAPAKCPTCRHPEHGGIRPEFLRIDTALQDEILQFLRTKLGIPIPP